MASERWEDIVDKEFGPNFFRPATLTKLRVVKLLARQHASVVRRVKKYDDPTDQYSERAKVVHDILAALATHRKGRT